MKIPYNFIPRDYQLPLLKAIDGGIKRAFCLWHRRAGKDKALWNLIIKKAVEKSGVYYYFFPTYTQAKKVIWDGIDNDGFPFLDHVPESLIMSKDSQALKIEIKSMDGKSIIQLIGTDKYDAIRGTNPVGCVFSEYSFHNPMAWEVVRPILAINGGWAVFNTTPNGKNHAHTTWTMAENNKNWFTQKLTVDDTQIVSQEVLEEERMEMSREMFLQEYHVSFDVGMIGSVYGEAMETAIITDLPIHQRPVDFYFDIGSSDATAIWMKQNDGEFFNMVGYHESHRKKIEFYFSIINDFLERNKCSLGNIYLPHDSKHKHFGQNETVFNQFVNEFGESKVIFIPVCQSKLVGIDKARRIIPKIRFHKDNCSQGISCLENYHYKYNEKTKSYSKEPDHDWSSHGADAFRYLAESMGEVKRIETKIEVEDYDNDEPIFSRF